MNESNFAEINALHQLLDNSDYKSAQIIESLVLTMQDATAINFISKYVAWIKTSVSEYGDIIRQRAEWRKKLAEMEHNESND